MNEFIAVLKDSLYKISIFRSLSNYNIKKIKISGNVLDIGSGEEATYHKFDNIRILDIKTIGLAVGSFHPTIIQDLEEKLPIAKESYDNIFAFNILEHIYNHSQLLNECYRILKNAGNIFIIAPFLYRIHADPDDFFRYTSHSLSKLLSETGFKNIKIKVLGLGPLTAAYSQVQPIIPKFLAILFLPVLMLSMALDKVIVRVSRKYTKKETFPLG